LADSSVDEEVFARDERRQLSQLTARNLQVCDKVQQNRVSPHLVLGSIQRRRNHVTYPPINDCAALRLPPA
jgi:hypothetical protein